MLTPMGAHVLRRNNVPVSGPPAGPPMIFAHGSGCDQNRWRFLLKAAAAPGGH
jgi:sigma-B regulation protein RsbQ